MSYAGLTPTFTSAKAGSVLVIDETVYFGDPNTDGTFRIQQDGTDLKIQVRVAGVYVDKDVINP